MYRKDRQSDSNNFIIVVIIKILKSALYFTIYIYKSQSLSLWSLYKSTVFDQFVWNKT